MKCEIISVGTELLLGNILNSNSKYLSERLANLGLDVYNHITVGDNENRLMAVVHEAFTRSDLLVFTGGLGPTDDDITRETVARAMNLPIHTDVEIFNKIDSFFKKIGRPMPEINKKQANVPEGAIVLNNDNGTAPGLILSSNGKHAVLLPGPPLEMIPLFEEKVVPWIKTITDTQVIESRILRIVGIGESSVQERLQHIFDRQSNPSLAPYAKNSEVHLRITAKTKNKEEAISLIKPMENEIIGILGDAIYAFDGDSLEQTVVSLAKLKKITLATSESCTGGLISSRITDVPGSSDVFLGGVISYSNELKNKLLNVKLDTLEKFGAVSAETAIEMAEGVRLLTGANIGISSTGIAGPSGGSEEKPVGLAYIGISTANGTEAFKNMAFGNREKIKWHTSTRALDIIRRKMLL